MLEFFRFLLTYEGNDLSDSPRKPLGTLQKENICILQGIIHGLILLIVNKVHEQEREKERERERVILECITDMIMLNLYVMV